MPDNPQAETLQSWKEISAYVGRAVRTLQRYETLMGFPIRRPLGNRRSSVRAFKAEVNEWLQRSPQRSSRNGHEHKSLVAAELAKTREQARSSRQQAVQMRQLVRQQREGIHHAVQQLKAFLSKHS